MEKNFSRIRELEEELDSLRKERGIENLNNRLSSMKEGHYYKLHLSSVEIIIFEYDSKNCHPLYDGSALIFHNVFYCRMTLASIISGVAHDVYLRPEDGELDVTEITKEDFETEINRCKDALSGLVD